MGLRDRVFLGAVLTVASPAWGQVSFNDEPVVVHGFVSQGFLYTTNNNFLARSSDGSFEFAEAGVNFTKQLDDDLRLGVQVFARDLGPLGNYSLKADWFYVDYKWTDWLGIRVGRTKLPFGLYNDASDIDAARLPILLPQSVYPLQNRDFLLAQTGTELYGYKSLGKAGALEYRAYGGTIFLDSTPTPGSPYEVGELAIPYISGGRLLWESPVDGLRMGGSLQTLRLDTDLLFKDPSLGSVALRIPVVLWTSSVEYAARRLLLAAEYGRWHVDVESSEPMFFPETSTVSERGHVMMAYRLNKRVQSGIYYSVLFPNMDNRTGQANQQHDIAGTVRLDVTPQWLIKLEVHYMNGTGGLSSALNDNQPLDSLKNRWIGVLAKATAHF